MKKTTIALSVLAFAAMLCVVMLFAASNDYAHARKLVQSIEQGDFPAVQRIVSERPSCVNTVTTPLPGWLCSLVDYRPTYPLIAACGSDNLEMVEYLIAHGADVNCSDGRTPLSITYAAKRTNWHAISSCLIANGASLDYVTEYSPAAASALCDILKVRPGVLLEGYVPESEAEVTAAFYFALNNASLDRVNWSRVLQHAVSNDHIEIVQFLLAQGYCHVNDSSTGMTPLMFAARDSTRDMVNLLLSFGADASFTSTDGKTAYDYAVQAGSNEVAAILSP